jgi:hypothetical protein
VAAGQPLSCGERSSRRALLARRGIGPADEDRSALEVNGVLTRSIHVEAEHVRPVVVTRHVYGKSSLLHGDGIELRVDDQLSASLGDGNDVAR